MKHKTVPKALLKDFKGNGSEFSHNTKAVIDCTCPDNNIYSFNGSAISQHGVTIPLDENNFVLRGCSLRNTNYIYGVITYTGHETKTMLNSVKARPKKSKIERLMNKQIIGIFLM